MTGEECVYEVRQIFGPGSPVTVTAVHPSGRRGQGTAGSEEAARQLALEDLALRHQQEEAVAEALAARLEQDPESLHGGVDEDGSPRPALEPDVVRAHALAYHRDKGFDPRMAVVVAADLARGPQPQVDVPPVPPRHQDEVLP